MLEGKVAFITGASRGIGKAIASKFAEHGATVIINSLNKNTLEFVAADISQKFNREVVPMAFDITSLNEIKMAFQTIHKQFKSLDILVNNAGILIPSLIEMVSQSQIEKQFQTNIFSQILTSQYSVRLMSRKRQGSIVNISSIMGAEGKEGQCVYAATKAAVIGFTRSLSKEVAPKNIRVNAIAPGFIDTEMAGSADVVKRQELINSIGMNRMGTGEEVADTALYLASDLSNYVTGQVIGVDGGMIV